MWKKTSACLAEENVAIVYRSCQVRSFFHGLIDCLTFDFFRNSSFNTLVLLFSNLLSNATIARIATEHISIEDSNSSPNPCNDLSRNRIIRPGNWCYNHVKNKSPNWVEQKAEIYCNHDTKKLELSLKTANQHTSASGIDCQYKGRQRGQRGHKKNLQYNETK